MQKILIPYLTAVILGAGMLYFLPNLEVDGFSRLGSDAPPIKQKLITGTIPTYTVELDSISIDIGIDVTKILGVQIFSESSSTTMEFIPPSTNNFHNSREYDYWIENISSTNYLTIQVTGNNSSLVEGQAFKALITYTE